MMYSHAIAFPNQLLSKDQIMETLHKGLNDNFRNQRVLVLIPDHTRSLPLPFLFRSLVDILCDVKQLDFMVALGTHPPLSEESINRLIGITAEDCAQLNLGYLDPSKIHIDDWKDREEEGVLYVPTAGEILFRMK